MSNKKAVVFVSHIAEEAEIAIELKKLIEQSFLNGVEVFVSSDENSNGVGEEWLDKIRRNLSDAIFAIIICSPTSINRPWINFEAGAAWIKNIKIAPLCHSGLVPKSLPIPLTTFNGVLLDNPKGLDNLLLSISREIGLTKPTVDFSLFLNSAHKFQREYTLLKKVKDIFSNLEHQAPSFTTNIVNNGECNVYIPLQEKQYYSDAFLFLEEQNILSANVINANITAIKTLENNKSDSYNLIQYQVIEKENLKTILFECGIIRPLF